MDKLAPILTDKRFFIAGRAASLSSQIVAQVRDDLFEKKLKPGDFLGTEKELAARYEVSRMVARDALRTLSALGIVDIRWARAAARASRPATRACSPRRSRSSSILPASPRPKSWTPSARSRCMAAELAALNATAADHAKLRSLLADAEAALGDNETFTRVSLEFHLAVAEASHNRVLVTQFISLHHVSWPRRNRTLTPKVARRVLDVHKELAALIEMRDGAGARQLMDDHVKMIKARRVAEHRGNCC